MEKSKKMANYNINLRNLKSELSEFVSCKENFHDMYQSYYQYSLSVDSVWNDANTLSFQNHMKSELEKLDELNDCLEKNISEISNFIEQIVLVFQKNGCSKNEFVLNFNEDMAYKSLKLLMTVQDKLNDIADDFESFSIPSSSSAYSDIVEVAHIYTGMLREIDEVLRYYRNVIQDVVDVISLTKSKMSQIEAVRILDNQLKFVWDVTSTVKPFEITSSVNEVSSTVKDNDVDKVAFSKPEVDDVLTTDANENVEEKEISPEYHGEDVETTLNNREVDSVTFSVPQEEDVSYQNANNREININTIEKDDVESVSYSDSDSNMKTETMNLDDINNVRTTDSSSKVEQLNLQASQIEDVSTISSTSNVSVQNIDVASHAQAEVGEQNVDVAKQDIHVNDVQEVTAKDILDTIKPID